MAACRARDARDLRARLPSLEPGRRGGAVGVGGRRADAQGRRRRDADGHPPHRPRRPDRRGRVRRRARGLQGAGGRGRVHRPLRPGADQGHPGAAGATRAVVRDLLARRRLVAGGRAHAHRDGGEERRGRARGGSGVSAEAPTKGVVPPSEPGGRSGFLSDVIVELGFASADAVEEAVREARSGSTVAQVLVEKGSISEEQLARATAERYGLAYIDLSNFEVDRNAAALIRPSAARRYKAVPVGFVAGGLLVAMRDPADSLAVNEIAVMTKLEVQPAATTRSGLDALLAELAAAAEADAEGGPEPPPGAA